MVLNTSFNIMRGEPIVESPHGALRSFLHAESNSIDRMFLAGHWLKRRQCPLDAPDGFDPDEIIPERRIDSFRSETFANREGDVLRVRIFVSGVNSDEETAVELTDELELAILEAADGFRVSGGERLP